MSTPKARFQKSPYAKGWSDLVDSQQFTFAADMAVLQLMDELQPAADQAAANEFKRQGAIQFLRILRDLGVNPKTPPQPKGNELTYR